MTVRDVPLPTRSVSLRIGLASLFVLVAVITSISIGAATFLSVRRMIRQDIRERLHDAAGAAALSIDPDAHAHLQKTGDEVLPEYASIRARLRAIRSAGNSFRFVYTMRRDDVRGLTFVVDAEEDAATTSRIGEPVDRPTPAMLTAFAQPPAIVVEPALSTDKWGTFLSGYAPIVDKNGRIEAVLGIDISAENILAYERRLLAIVTFITVVVTVLVAAIASAFSRNVSRPLLAIAGEMQRVRQFDLAGGRLPTSHVREVAEMSDALAKMKAGLRSFRKYVPADLVRQLLALGREAELGAERRMVSILFCDIGNFTAISEQLAPEDLAAWLAEYLGGMTRIILRNGGTVDKYVGDAIMAFWNAPGDVDDHAERAVRTALECRAFTGELSTQSVRRGGLPFRTRFGVNSGEVFVGNFGYEDRMDYTAIGHHVNVASRLEGLNKVYGSEILCGEQTWDLVGDRFVGRLIDRVVVKGSEAAVRVYEPLEAASAGLTTAFGLGTELYMARRFNEAAAAFGVCLVSFPGDGPSAALQTRAHAFAVDPPPADWDGVFRATEK